MPCSKIYVLYKIELKYHLHLEDSHMIQIAHLNSSYFAPDCFIPSKTTASLANMERRKIRQSERRILYKDIVSADDIRKKRDIGVKNQVLRALKLPRGKMKVPDGFGNGGVWFLIDKEGQR